MLPPFVVKMIVTKVLGVLVDKVRFDKIEDYVFKDNVLDKQVKELRDDLDKVKEQLIYLKEGKQK